MSMVHKTQCHPCWASLGLNLGEDHSHPKHSPSPRGMVVVYLGKRVKEFTDHFGGLGHIPGHNGWASKVAKAAAADKGK